MSPHPDAPAPRIPRARLPTLEATFEFLTPAFLGGATPEAELRIPSIRGALRHWLRALDPAWRTREARLFGDTAQQGAVSLSTMGPKEPTLWSWKTHEAYLRRQWRSGEGKFPGNGLAYLGYVLSLPGNEGRMALPAGANFRVDARVFHSRLEPAEAGEVSKDAWALMGSLWALGTLGALGMRARRGFGSLQITQWRWRMADAAWDDALARLPLVEGTPDAKAAADTVRSGLDTLGAVLGVPTGDQPHLGRGCTLVVRPSPSRRPPGPEWAWAEPLADIGLQMQQFRTGMKADRDLALQYLEAKNKRLNPRLNPVPARAGFGLPLTFRFKRTDTFEGGSFELNPTRKDGASSRRSDRWPSPLRIRVVRTRRGLHPLVLLTAGLHPAAEEIRVRSDRNNPGRVTHDVTGTFMATLELGQPTVRR